MFNKRNCCVLAGLLTFGVVVVAAAPHLSHAAGPPKKGNLTGVTVDQFGDPVAGATVQLFRDANDIDYFAETTSDDNGEFSFKRLPADDYTVSALRRVINPIEACSGSAAATVVARQTTNVTVNMTCQ